MSRILIPHHDSWYEELRVMSSYFETEYETKFRQHISSVFPDYYAIDYKIPVTAPGYPTKKPDFALIKKDYSEWWLVEVELENHELEEVLDQVEVFINAEFNYILAAKEISKRILSAYPGETIDMAKLQKMVAGWQKVLVVVDEYDELWNERIIEIGASFCVFQVYRDINSVEAYRIAGIYPVTSITETFCNSDARNGNLIKIIDPVCVNVVAGTDIEIIYNEKIGKFSVLDIGGEIFLKFVGKMNHIPAREKYSLCRDIYDRLVIKIN